MKLHLTWHGPHDNPIAVAELDTVMCKNNSLGKLIATQGKEAEERAIYPPAIARDDQALCPPMEVGAYMQWIRDNEKALAAYFGEANKMTEAEITEPPNGERIVSMVEHKGRLIMATERNVYELRQGEWHLIKFAPPAEVEVNEHSR